MKINTRSLTSGGVRLQKITPGSAFSSFTCRVSCVVPPHADVLTQTLAQSDRHRTHIPVLEEKNTMKSCDWLEMLIQKLGVRFLNFVKTAIVLSKHPLEQ